MKIYACADIHGFPERIERVRELVQQLSPDVVIIAGDLTHAGLGRDALGLLDELPCPVVAIPGNMDPPFVAKAIAESRAKNILTASVQIQGVTFCGPDAAVERCDILVAHEPPYGVLDTIPTGLHIGSPKVARAVEKLRPRVMVCGHVHESPGVARLGETIVVNCTMGDGIHRGASILLREEGVEVTLL